MTTNEHAAFRELIPAYGLGSLDPDEVGDLALHLKACPACLDLLNDYRTVVDALALAAPDAAPSPALRGRLLAEAGRDRSRTRVPRTPPPSTLWVRPAWASYALVGLLIISLGALIWLAVRSPAAPSTVSLTPSEAAPGARGELRFDPTGAATLEVWRLPTLPAGQAYQLWLVSGDARETGAMFAVNENGWAEVPVDLSRPAADYDRFGITIEPEGGSPGPTGEGVLAGEY